jgi:hypothetical protein
MSKELKWNGCWEEKNDRIICRWMLVWKKVENNFVGCICGYSGGGSFQIEKFILNKNTLLLSENSNFSTFDDQIISIAEDCQDFIMDTHDENVWNESENLILINSRNLRLKKEKDLLYGGVTIPVVFSDLFNSVGLISAPLIFNLRK